jgi:hypothetical protein
MSPGLKALFESEAVSPGLKSRPISEAGFCWQNGAGGVGCAQGVAGTSTAAAARPSLRMTELARASLRSWRGLARDDGVGDGVGGDEFLGGGIIGCYGYTERNANWACAFEGGGH